MKLRLILLLFACSLSASDTKNEHQLPPDNTKVIHIYNKTLLYFKIDSNEGTYKLLPLTNTAIFLSPQKLDICAYGPLDFMLNRPLHSIEKSISKYTKKLLLYPCDNNYGWEATTSFFPW